eukprot:6180143-Pleurochrysis_carterae.AAC.4
MRPSHRVRKLPDGPRLRRAAARADVRGRSAPPLRRASLSATARVGSRVAECVAHGHGQLSTPAESAVHSVDDVAHGLNGNYA